MENVSILTTDPGKRVENAINTSITLYLNKILSNFYSIGLENGFQMHLANEIQKQLDIHTFDSNERFVVLFEQNIPIGDKKDYIDIVVDYHKNNCIKRYPIELKFKKITDSAPDLGAIGAYIDIYTLEKQKQQLQSQIDNCYFIFLTDYNVYTKSSHVGTRAELPLYDSYTIEANHHYTVTGNAALKATAKYPNGFLFTNDYTINYNHMILSNNRDLYYFILKI